MGGGLYGKLLETAFLLAAESGDSANSGASANPVIFVNSVNSVNSVKTPADIIDLFELDEEQQAAAEIFTVAKDYPNEAAIEKALNDMVKKIKLTWLNSRIEIEKSDLNVVKSLHFQIKNAASLNINIHGG